jgi:hypothetical protein
LPPICHPNKPLSICIKVKSGIELPDNLFVPIILEAHHLSHLQLITSLFDEVEVLVALGCHPLPINPFGLYHRLLLVKIDQPVPIGVEERPKAPIGTLLAANIDWSFRSLIDCCLLGLLRVLEEHPIGVLHVCMNLESLGLLFLTGMRGMMG